MDLILVKMDLILGLNMLATIPRNRKKNTSIWIINKVINVSEAFILLKHGKLTQCVLSLHHILPLCMWQYYCPLFSSWPFFFPWPSKCHSALVSFLTSLDYFFSESSVIFPFLPTLQVSVSFRLLFLDMFSIMHSS